MNKKKLLREIFTKNNLSKFDGELVNQNETSNEYWIESFEKNKHIISACVNTKLPMIKVVARI